ncbi:class I SAM-dependent methyltransferase [Dethiothermospora halolimnae]|uniref:class I SAM-dependent methyltransferase n=1 Tax=Dethiothermospora halolimnae TaxID=3114390 RepID=UPI003CCB7F43
MKIKNQKEYFNKNYKQWSKNTPKDKIDISTKIIELIGLKEGESVIDVACGTGILYYILKDKKLTDYLAIDISEKMLKELQNIFPDVNTKCLDFDKKVNINNKFDYVIIFNGIPHFENIDIAFENVKNTLKPGGKFLIAQTKTRDGIKEHHRKIGYDLGREPIPRDNTLKQLSEKYGFTDIIIKDQEFFYFSCKKKQ